jgi:hypothetical protein
MVLRIGGGTPASSVFGLFGTKENTATFALGWVLQQSRALRASLMPLLTVEEVPIEEMIINLQRHGEDGGYTDIELDAPNKFHLIVEAKRGWIVPQQDQLLRYVDRLLDGTRRHKGLISLSAADKVYASRLPDRIADIDLTHVSWSEVRRAVRQALAATTSSQEKLWLRQLDIHLGAYVTVRDPSDNQVYVVSLSSKPILEGNTYRWIDVVEIDSSYFHPVGGSGWPVLPPNYIGFRYGGKLQSVHHVASFEVVQDVSKRNKQWPKTEVEHFVYELGPSMRPTATMHTGNLFRAQRVWCAIDTLLSGQFSTISEARDETKSRLEFAERDDNSAR